MKVFASLVDDLDTSPSTNDKLKRLGQYLAQTQAEDAAWAVYFLAGGRLRRVLPPTRLREMVALVAEMEPWLFEACYHAAGDLAETVSLVWPDLQTLPEDPAPSVGLAEWVTRRLIPLGGLSAEDQLERMKREWSGVTPIERFVLVKILGGGFRIGVSRSLVQRALAKHAGLDEARIARRMVGYTRTNARPTADDFQSLMLPVDEDSSAHRVEPFPFCLAHPLEPMEDVDEMLQRLGPPSNWLIEWKYDGIRAQVLKDEEGVSIWSRGEEVITESFPEVVEQAQHWPEGLVIDGELLVWRGDRPGSFNDLQKRLQRKRVTAAVRASEPVRLMAYDLLAIDGQDLRQRPLEERRALLEDWASRLNLHVSPRVDCDDPDPAASDWSPWLAVRSGARDRGVEGLMLKHRRSIYGVGRQKADGAGWWKWKLDPFNIDAVLIYAQSGHGRRAGLYTDYTFAVWSRPPESEDEAVAVIEAIVAKRQPQPGDLQLVPFAKAYSGLSDAEIKRVDASIRRHTIAKFGPVRSVRPHWVLELGFEGIAPSPRHKSGLAVRFPRMLRIREEKPVWQANSLADLRGLLAGPAARGCSVPGDSSD